MIKASYLASLSIVWNSKHKAYLAMTPSGLMMTNPVPDPSELENPSIYTSQILVGYEMGPCVNIEDSVLSSMVGSLGMVHSTKK